MEPSRALLIVFIGARRASPTMRRAVCRELKSCVVSTPNPAQAAAQENPP
jgi:hypothetical protein